MKLCYKWGQDEFEMFWWKFRTTLIDRYEHLFTIKYDRVYIIEFHFYASTVVARVAFQLFIERGGQFFRVLSTAFTSRGNKNIKPIELVGNDKLFILIRADLTPDTLQVYFCGRSVRLTN